MTLVRQAFSMLTSRGSPESSGTCMLGSLWQLAQLPLPEWWVLSKVLSASAIDGVRPRASGSR